MKTCEMEHIPRLNSGSALFGSSIVAMPVFSANHVFSEKYQEVPVIEDSASGDSGHLASVSGDVSLATRAESSCIGIENCVFTGSSGSGHSDTGLQPLEEEDDVPIACARWIGAPSSLPRNMTDLAGVAEDQWFDAHCFSDSISNVVMNFNVSDERRTLDVLDLFAGHGSVSKAFKSVGYCAASYDIHNDTRCDFTSKTGFMQAMSLMLQLRSGGLIMAGPPCSMWTFLASSVHCRSNQCPEGDTSNKKVRMSNLIVRNLAVLLSIADSRGVYWIIEQPSTSKMFDYPQLKHQMHQCNAVRCFTYGLFWA